MPVREISVSELQKLRSGGSDVFVLDVRSRDEYDYANIGPDLLVPLDELVDRMPELSPHENAHVVVMCRSGARSAQACNYLMQQGFSNVSNLRGGIRAWSVEVDPKVPLY
ncbi:MAG: rhodanese-like domain-containing protein [Bacteroidetes bacterium]|nr:rhodanese-like domain-containing protein [Bacteroidota bacterium]